MQYLHPANLAAVKPLASVCIISVKCHNSIENKIVSYIY